jgi:tRNA dimethylallyltransferase
MLVADRVGAEIVSVDSMQVYRQMDIGTAKPTAADRALVAHHMIDIVDPSDSYSVAEFRIEARRSTESVTAPILVAGGSGLHFRSLVDPLDFGPTDGAVRTALESRDTESLREDLVTADPEAADHVDFENRRRVVRAMEILQLTGATPSARAASPRAQAVRGYESEIPLVAVGVDAGDGLAERIEVRFDQMLADGLVEEVTTLMDGWGPTASQAVGYREMGRVVAGEWSHDEGRKRAIEATTALARRQRTYFRRDPRIVWLQWHDDPEIVAAAALQVFQEAGWSS